MGNDIQRADAMKKVIKSVAEKMDKIKKSNVKRIKGEKNLEDFKKALIKLLKDKRFMFFIGIEKALILEKALEAISKKDEKMEKLTKAVEKMLDDPRIREALIKKH